jgi:pSer/pThr/pTyr-binding forkhead associated (FHA) protein
VNVELRVIRGAVPRRQNALLQFGVHLLGRADYCDFRLEADPVSRRHCLVRVAYTAAYIYDLNSRWGTYVNGERVTWERRLHDGDLVQIGDFVIQIHLRPAPDAPLPPVYDSWPGSIGHPSPTLQSPDSETQK